MSRIAAYPAPSTAVRRYRFPISLISLESHEQRSGETTDWVFFSDYSAPPLSRICYIDLTKIRCARCEPLFPVTKRCDSSQALQHGRVTVHGGITASVGYRTTIFVEISRLRASVKGNVSLQVRIAETPLPSLSVDVPQHHPLIVTMNIAWVPFLLPW